MTDPDTSTKELRDKYDLANKIYEIMAYPVLDKDRKIAQERLLEAGYYIDLYVSQALQSAKRDCQRKVEAIIKDQETVNLMSHGRIDCKSCSLAETLRKDLK